MVLILGLKTEPEQELPEFKMQQTKISFEEKHIKILNDYKAFGFKNKSSMVRAAVDNFIKLLEKQKLANSAKLYAEIYEEDSELKDLTNSALEDWPK